MTVPMSANDNEIIAGSPLVTPLELLISNAITRHRKKGSRNIDTARAIIGQMVVAGYTIVPPVEGTVS